MSFKPGFDYICFNVIAMENIKFKSMLLLVILQDHRILREHWMSLFGLEALSTRGALQPNRIHHYQGTAGYRSLKWNQSEAVMNCS